jgi:hypothetical protein
MKVRSEAAQTGVDTRRIWRFSASATEGPADYAIVPPQEVKIAQSVIVQYVAPPNMLWYAPYCTIEGILDSM